MAGRLPEKTEGGKGYRGMGGKRGKLAALPPTGGSQVKFTQSRELQLKKNRHESERYWIVATSHPFAPHWLRGNTYINNRLQESLLV